MRCLLMSSLLALQMCLANPVLAAVPVPDTLVGGVDLPDRYLFMVAHLPPAEAGDEKPAAAEAATTGTVFLGTGEELAIGIESRNPGSVRFMLHAGSTVYVLEGRFEEGKLAGTFFQKGQEGSRFPFHMVPMRRLSMDDLPGRVGTHVFEDGSTLAIRTVAPGYLRAYDRQAGTFHNYYPASPAVFFRGQGLDRPVPRTADLEFTGKGVLHSTRGRGRPVPEPQAELAWKEGAGRARISLPGDAVVHLIQVKPGTFGMGDPVNIEEAEAIFGFASGTIKSIEYPRRQTRLTKPYWLGRSEVTNAQFKAFVDETAYITVSESRGAGLLWRGDRFERVKGASWRHPGREIESDEPVVMLSWLDADAFCDWLARRTGRNFRLPSEAEWEYASRAGQDGLYGFGSDPQRLGEFAWFNVNAGGRARKVESRKPNAWGFYDMHGNVWEWTADRHGEIERTRAATDPSGPETGEGRVLRGGSWLNGAYDCRSAYRAHDDADLAEPHFGFRIAATGE